VKANTQRGMQAKVMGHQPAAAPTNAPPDPERLVPSGRPKVLGDAVGRFGRHMRPELEGGIDWGWLEGLQQSQRWARARGHPWSGAGGAPVIRSAGMPRVLYSPLLLWQAGHFQTPASYSLPGAACCKARLD
jgi:hypothetical protein